MNPVRLPFFDDPLSFGHAVLGAIAARSSYGALISLAFLVYQMWEVEPIGNKLGDFGEFYAGYLLAEGAAR